MRAEPGRQFLGHVWRDPVVLIALPDRDRLRYGIKLDLPVGHIGGDLAAIAFTASGKGLTQDCAKQRTECGIAGKFDIAAAGITQQCLSQQAGHEPGRQFLTAGGYGKQSRMIPGKGEQRTAGHVGQKIAQRQRRRRGDQVNYGDAIAEVARQSQGHGTAEGKSHESDGFRAGPFANPLCQHLWSMQLLGCPVGREDAVLIEPSAAQAG